MDNKTFTFILLVAISLLITIVQGFTFPNEESIKEMFDDFKTKTGKSKNERSKRQAAEIGDESLLPYEVRSSALPLWSNKSINLRYMPTMGNGFIGTTVYSDKLYLHNLFTGKGPNSHRAAIPALLMSRIKLSNPEIENRGTRKFVYNALEGYFMETIKSEYAYIEQKFYMHQKYVRLYVMEINYVMQPVNYGGGYLSLSYPPAVSDDIEFNQKVPYIGNWVLTGRTKEGEDGGPGRTVAIYYQQPISEISIAGSQKQANYTFIMAVDTIEANARSEFDQAQIDLLSGDKSNYNFFMSHVNAWKEIWDGGRVELEGASTNQVIKATWFAQAYIFNSLPPENPKLPPPYSDVYYTCGRNSLGKGDLGRDYQGHVMWDNELYILPAILPFHPNMARQMLRYRSAMGKAASQIAKNMGAPGYHYPWESAYSGIEVSPETCSSNDTDCLKKRLFTTSGVALAIRYYISMTMDKDFMVNIIYQGCDMSREVTKFLASQLTYNPAIKRFELLDATGPDLNHPGVKNNAFLLTSISLAIHFGRYLSCLCQRNERDEISDETMRKAFYLNLPYDRINRLHYQFEGFNSERDRPIKQADTIMLGHPVSWNFTWDIQRNDLNFYELLTEARTPAMTLSWFVIGWKRTNEIQKMTATFVKSYQDYIIQPFKIWTEYTERNEGDQARSSVNFLPGMGGFLQSLIYGFAGLRIKPDRIEFHSPMPPPQHQKLTLRNFHYLSNNLTIVIEANKVTITVLGIEPKYRLILKMNRSSAEEISLDQIGKPIVLESASDGFYIYNQNRDTCELPKDYVYMPYGYNSWVDQLVNESDILHSHKWIQTFLISLLCTLFVGRNFVL